MRSNPSSSQLGFPYADFSFGLSWWKVDERVLLTRDRHRFGDKVDAVEVKKIARAGTGVKQGGWTG
jgi:hypothetical protein